MDIELLFREYPTSESPGLDTLDPRLAEVTDLIQNGDFTGAANAVASLLSEDVCDIRLLGYLGFGIFLDAGPASLGPLADGYSHVLEASWDAFGPVKKKEKAASQAFVWFAKQVLKKIQREEGQQGPAWSQWTQSMTTDDVDTATSSMRRLQANVDERLGESGSESLDLLGNLRTWLDGFRHAVDRPAAEEAPEEEGATEGTEDTSARSASASGDAGDLSIQGSPHLHMLLKRMDAFGRLVERGEFKRALIIADDVNQTLESFNPVLYFPSFFREFAKFQARHAQELMEYADYRDSPEWMALRTLYLVDVEEFVEL